MHRQLVPGLRTRQSKCTGAKVRDRGGDNEVATGSGSESLSATDDCDWSTVVTDVRRCQSMQCLVRHQTKFELDALQDGKPVDDHLPVLEKQKSHKLISSLMPHKHFADVV